MLGAASLAMTAAAAAVFLFHLGIRPVLSGSMRPTYGPGWAIVTRPIPVADVRKGDIVVFTPPGLSSPFAHRVVSVSGSPSHPVITTKGDANSAPDPWHARLDGPTVPEVVTAVPWLGRLMLDVESRDLRLFLLVVAGLALCVAGTRFILRGGGEVPAEPAGAGGPSTP